MRTSVAAMVGCSMAAASVSAFCVIASPPPSAKNTGSCPDETPIALSFWSIARANRRAAQLVR